MADASTDGTTRPNLFIIGAQKSGTTSLHTYLSAHPDVFMSEPKEPGYFVPELDYYPRDLDWYLSLFENAGGAKFIGESSTHYSKRPSYDGVAQRIAQFAPDARLVYVMRDPIRRAISHYWHNTRTLEEHRSILDALRRNPEYKSFGDYEYQLRPYVELFGLQRIHIVIFEELTKHPRASVDGVLAWLGLSSLPAGVAFTRENALPDNVSRVRGRGRLQRFRHHPVWEAMSPHVPRSVKGFGKRLALKSTNPRATPDDEAVALLRPWARSAIARLGTLLEREFPEWTTSLGPQ